MWDGQLKSISITIHHIQLKRGSKPRFEMHYHAGQKKRELEGEEVTEQLRAGVIEPLFAEWASPVVRAPKMLAALRLCVYYRRFKAMKVRTTYFIPRMGVCRDSLGDAVVFTTLDANSG